MVKDTNKEELTDLFHPFEGDPITINQTKANMTVNGHTVLFEVHSMDMNMKELTAGISALNGYTAENFTFTKFHSEWHCEKSNLTYVATGFVMYNQVDEMKKMIQSIDCHQNKKYIIF